MYVTARGVSNISLAFFDSLFPKLVSEELDDRKWLFERVALELRTSEGLPLSRVDASLSSNLTTLLEEGMAVVKDQRLVLTRAGKPLLDSIAEMLLPD